MAEKEDIDAGRLLRQNNIGSLLDNRGAEMLSHNAGAEHVNPKDEEEEEEEEKGKGPMNKLRLAKAKEFGKKKTEVGF
jgi:hypothetical protein